MTPRVGESYVVMAMEMVAVGRFGIWHVAGCGGRHLLNKDRHVYGVKAKSVPFTFVQTPGHSCF